jgi:hypothetical protein
MTIKVATTEEAEEVSNSIGFEFQRGAELKMDFCAGASFRASAEGRTDVLVLVLTGSSIQL